MDDNVEHKIEPSPEMPRSDEKVGTSREIIHGEGKSWATRNGLNLTSFTRHEDLGMGSMELERAMKPRHLHMIAIGGRSVLGGSLFALGFGVTGTDLMVVSVLVSSSVVAAPLRVAVLAPS